MCNIKKLNKDELIFEYKAINYAKEKQQYLTKYDIKRLELVKNEIKIRKINIY